MASDISHKACLSKVYGLPPPPTCDRQRSAGVYLQCQTCIPCAFNVKLAQGVVHDVGVGARLDG